MAEYPDMKARRLFAGVAVAATEDLRRAWTDLRRELQSERIRWTRPENLHLTVEFFGATAEETIPTLANALAAAAGASPAFALRLAGLGTFGGARHPRVLWIGVDSPGLAALHARAADALRAAGRSPEARAFAPHLTLGRIDRLNDPAAFAAALETQRGRFAEEQAVRELILYESASGRYVPIGAWPLQVVSNSDPAT